MTGGAVFGLLWAAVGILLGIRWRAERARWQSTAPTLVAPAPRSRFGTGALDGSGRRTVAMLGAYAVGALLVSVGTVTGTAGLLGLGALFVNVGTIYRFLVLALDREHLESPVIPKHRPARHLGSPVSPGLLDLAN